MPSSIARPMKCRDRGTQALHWMLNKYTMKQLWISKTPLSALCLGLALFFVACTATSTPPTPSPVGVDKPTPAEPEGEHSAPLFSRPAGDGVIIETSFSPFHSNYRIQNYWFARTGDQEIAVYAGGQRDAFTNGEALSDDISWPGVLLVNVADSTGKILPEEGGSYSTPINVGPVRIVDATGSRLTLAARNGAAFVFDVAARQFVSTEMNAPVNRIAGPGTLVESGNTPYEVDGYRFTNYWYKDREDATRITVMAGEKDGDKQGAFVIVISSPGDTTLVVEGVAYLTPVGEALRLVDADEENLTLVSDGGLIFVFDLTTRQFVSSPIGNADNAPVILLNTAAPDYVTRTPTLTPTPRPTRTPLPTYNPYP